MFQLFRATTFFQSKKILDSSNLQCEQNGFRKIGHHFTNANIADFFIRHYNYLQPAKYFVSDKGTHFHFKNIEVQCISEKLKILQIFSSLYYDSQSKKMTNLINKIIYNCLTN
jgi:hypothetical protein